MSGECRGNEVSSDRSWITLLSPLPFLSYTPESFKEYIKSLYLKRVPKVRRGTPKKKGYSARLNAKGTVIITTKRKPKWVTQSELSEISVKLERPENEIFLKLKEKEFAVYAKAPVE